MNTLGTLLARLQSAEITSRELVEDAIQRISDRKGEGARAFVSINAQGALNSADAIDVTRAEGRNPPPLAGLPISLKDLFDVKDEVTCAGSLLLNEAPAAVEDAIIVSRLRAAGCILIGRTNMTEFAYSGLGINPHYGTPLNPFDRGNGRIPGGSSSGAAVSVADGMAAAAVGTDTGGSCRIPAAFCGITGFKPTARRIPLVGAFPLSSSFDSIGPLANSVDCCARLDAVMAGEEYQALVPAKLSELRIAVLSNIVLDGMDTTVAKAYERALSLLSAQGVKINPIKFPFLDELPTLNARGGIVAAEAFEVHREWLENREDAYDPRVSVRIKKALEQGPDEFKHLLETRQVMIKTANDLSKDYDAVIFPTVPVVAPLLADMADDAEYGRLNLLALRNPTIANFLDSCAISLPISQSGEAPVGLMVMADTMQDLRLFEIATAMEKLFQH